MTSGARSTGQGPRIGFDMGPARRPAAGVSVYVTELATALGELAPERIARLGVRAEGPIAPSSDVPGDTRLRGRLHLIWLQGLAERDARAAGCELVHYTNAVAPFRGSIPFVLSIHDVSLIRRPSDHPAGRLAALPFIVSGARRAQIVIVPSEATAREVRRLLHVPPERIVVIPLAARELPDGTADESAIGRLGLAGGRYILSIGTIEPRKNGVGLIAAFERLAAAHPTLRLVFAGGPGWRSGPFREVLRRSPVGDRIVLTGHLPDGAIAALLASCSALAYPSFYEGFGLPILEAMAAGAPVVTSDASSMPEVAGGAAVLVDPFDAASIAAGLEEALARHDELAVLGRAHAARRTWLDVGRETLAVYDRALGGAG